MFVLFKSTFLGNRSLSNARRFYGEKRKIGNKNLYLTENKLIRDEMWLADNHICTSHICAKGYKIRTLIKQ